MAPPGAARKNRSATRACRAYRKENETVSTPENNADTQRMLALRDGDDLALNDIIQRWQLPLVSFILRYVGNHSDALDLAQETFVRIFENRRRYRPSGQFSTWLFTIASNVCRNFLRWRERHPSLATPSRENGAGADGNPAGESAADTPTPADNAEHSDLACAVREHIQALPHDLKTAILLHEYEELSHPEIAAVLGCSAKAVETRLYRARKILREALARWRVPE
jgi:RNA polymerase sigma-70 factor, ECF subfamily